MPKKKKTAPKKRPQRGGKKQRYTCAARRLADVLKPLKVCSSFKVLFGIAVFLMICQPLKAADVPNPTPTNSAWQKVLNAMESLRLAGCLEIQTHQTAGYENISSDDLNVILTRGGEYLTECVKTAPDTGGAGGEPEPVTFYPVGVVDAGNGDIAYVNGGRHSSRAEGRGLYSTQRYQNDKTADLIYTLPVTPGDYKIILHFEENYEGAFAVGARVFGVYVNGVELDPALDLFATVGKNTPYTIEALTTDIGGVITVALKRILQNPTLAGIELLSTDKDAQLLTPKTVSIRWKTPSQNAAGEPEQPDDINGFNLELCPLGETCDKLSLGNVNQTDMTLWPNQYRARMNTEARGLVSEWSEPVTFEVAP